MTDTIEKGDKLWTRGPLGTRHYGIYAGTIGAIEHAVIHNSKVQGGVVIDPFSRFAHGQPVFIEGRAAPGHADFVVNSALAYLGNRYDLLSFNCEHLVNLAQAGEHKSQQLRNGATAAAFGALCLWAFSGNRPRYDASVDRYRDSRGRFVSR